MALLPVTRAGVRAGLLFLSFVAIWSLAVVPVCALTIHPVFSDGINADPNAIAIESGINAIIQGYEKTFADAIDISIAFYVMDSGLGESHWYYHTVSYTDYRAALATHGTSSDDATAIAHLPAGPNNPANGNQNVNLSFANSRALGFNVSLGPGQTDGGVWLNTSLLNYSRTNPDPDKYDFIGVVSHEINEVLGLSSSLNGSSNGGPAPTGPIGAMDVFRYGANGARSFDTGVNTLAYFSLDGTTQLAQFNQHQGGDFGDWDSYDSGGHPPRVQDAWTTPGVATDLGVELTALDAIGYHRVAITGDVNRDGIVNGQDISQVASNWLATGGNAADANGDHIVNGQDIALVASNWLHSSTAGSGGNGAASGTGAGTSVPEPSTLLLATIAVLFLLQRVARIYRAQCREV